MPCWPIWGFLGLFKPIGMLYPFQKKVNDEVSCDGICKFEIGTIKTTIKTYILTFWKTSEKAPKRGVFSTKSPRGTQTRVLPGSAVILLCS